MRRSSAGIPRDWVHGGAALPDLRADQHATRWRCRCTRSTAPCRWSGTSRRCPRSSTWSRTPGDDAEDQGNLFAAIDALRIPVEYLAELFTAGDAAPVDRVLQQAGGDALLHARHQHGPRARRVHPGRGRDDRARTMYDMYRLLAIAKYDERYVIPPAHAEQAHSLEELATECSPGLRRRPRHGRLRAVRRGLRRQPPRSRWRTSTMLKDRQTADTSWPPGGQAGTGQPAELGRQGRSRSGLFPPKPGAGGAPR
ncbi:MAG: hypothetical protein WKF47_16430 [Geodermatophilaceae bacterium]